MSEKGDDYLIAFIEGSCTRPSDEAQLKAIREQAGVVVALGACAHLGGVNAIRNRQELRGRPPLRLRRQGRVVRDVPGPPDLGRHPGRRLHPRLPDRPPGVRARRHGRAPGPRPAAARTTRCASSASSRRTSACTSAARPASGPITRAGCDAICPTYGDSCEGCRGLVPNPNIDSLKTVLGEHGLSVDQTLAKMTMFLTYQMMESEAAGHGNGKR